MTTKIGRIAVLVLLCTVCATAKEHRRAYYDQFKDKTQVVTNFITVDKVGSGFLSAPRDRYGYVSVALLYDCPGKQADCKTEWYNLVFTYEGNDWTFIDKKNGLRVEFLLDGKLVNLGESRWDGHTNPLIRTASRCATYAPACAVTEEITVAISAENLHKLLDAQEVKVQIADGLGRLEFKRGDLGGMQKSLGEPAEFKK